MSVAILAQATVNQILAIALSYLFLLPCSQDAGLSLYGMGMPLQLAQMKLLLLN
jgi:hypothetical protein